MLAGVRVTRLHPAWVMAARPGPGRIAPDGRDPGHVRIAAVLLAWNSPSAGVVLVLFLLVALALGLIAALGRVPDTQVDAPARA
jgi:hypothetical protein